MKQRLLQGMLITVLLQGRLAIARIHPGSGFSRAVNHLGAASVSMSKSIGNEDFTSASNLADGLYDSSSAGSTTIKEALASEQEELLRVKEASNENASKWNGLLPSDRSNRRLREQSRYRPDIEGLKGTFNKMGRNSLTDTAPTVLADETDNDYQNTAIDAAVGAAAGAATGGPVGAVIGAGAGATEGYKEDLQQGIQNNEETYRSGTESWQETHDDWVSNHSNHQGGDE